MDDTTFLTELKKVENKLSSQALNLTKGNIDDAQELLQATVVNCSYFPSVNKLYNIDNKL